MVEIIALGLALFAFATLRKLNKRLDDMAHRLNSSEEAVRALQQAAGLRLAEPPADQAARSAPDAPRPDQVPITPPEPAIEPPQPPTSVTPTAGIPIIATGQASEGQVLDERPGPSMEERLGTRWAVWVGGLALALGGLLLVRYSIEQGFFGPGLRILLGLAFAAALVACGEWLRRSERRLPIDVIPSAHIPGVLTAAGTAAAFGSLYAAHALYGFIGPGLTFILLGAVGIATMFAAALHGPWLAGLGLAGSYISPLLISSAQPNPWPVVLYLAVVAASAMGLARLRHWLWLAALAVAGGIFWGLLLAARISSGDLDWTLATWAHTLVQLALGAAFIAIAPHLATEDRDATPDPIASAALASFGILAALVITGAPQTSGVGLFTLAAVGLLLVTAYVSAPAAAGAIVAGLVALIAALAWPGLQTPPEARLLWSQVADILRLPDGIVAYLNFLAALAAAVAVTAGVRLWRGPGLPVMTKPVFSLAMTATPLLLLVIAYLRVTQFDRSISFAAFGVVLAALFAMAAGRFQSREAAGGNGAAMGDDGALVTGASAAAAVAALAFALTVSLSRGYLTAALALTALGTAFVAWRLNIPMLRHVVTTLGIVVLGRIAWDPRIMGSSVGTWPIFNWLLLGYGVPMLSFWGAARLLESGGAIFSSRIADAVAVLFAGLLVFFEIHHALNAGDPLAQTSGHVEQGLLALSSLGLSYALMRLDLGRANPVFRVGSLVFGAVSAVLAAVGLGLGENPLFSNDRVLGPVVFSTLFVAYLLPGIAAVALARAARHARPPWFVTLLSAVGAVLIFGYVTLETRHAFQGGSIGLLRSTSAAEQWAYSASWLLLGLVFLGYGLLRRNKGARMASAALVILSVLKVFLLDLNGLTGIWRAFSFIVLGLVLIGIGLLYQKVIFGKRVQPSAGTPAVPET